MTLLLRLALAFVIVVAGSLPSATAYANASVPCDRGVVEHHARSSDEGCSATHGAEVDHGLDHCTAAVGGCCAPLLAAPVVGAPVTTTVVVAWISAIDRAPVGHSFAPATPPPRA